MIEAQIEGMLKANKLILEDIVENGGFSLEELTIILDRHESLLNNLSFWLIQNNSKRFLYELTNHISWLLKNFS